MRSLQFHTYPDKVRSSYTDADPNASEAQRAAGNARVGTVHMHGLTISIEYPPGSTRRGRGKDGKEWSREVKNAYGYIRGTESEDGEHFDVWLGEHPESQLVFVFNFLTAEGNHDEQKAVCASRNLAEAKKVIKDNYPDGFFESRIGECRGFFMPEFREYLKKGAPLKTGKQKSASAEAFISFLVS